MSPEVETNPTTDHVAGESRISFWRTFFSLDGWDKAWDGETQPPKAAEVPIQIYLDENPIRLPHEIDGIAHESKFQKKDKQQIDPDEDNNTSIWAPDRVANAWRDESEKWSKIYSDALKRDWQNGGLFRTQRFDPENSTFVIREYAREVLSLNSKGPVESEYVSERVARDCFAAGRTMVFGVLLWLFYMGLFVWLEGVHGRQWWPITISAFTIALMAYSVRILSFTRPHQTRFALRILRFVAGLTVFLLPHLIIGISAITVALMAYSVRILSFTRPHQTRFALTVLGSVAGLIVILLPHIINGKLMESHTSSGLAILMLFMASISDIGRKGVSTMTLVLLIGLLIEFALISSITWESTLLRSSAVIFSGFVGLAVSFRRSKTRRLLFALAKVQNAEYWQIVCLKPSAALTNSSALEEIKSAREI